MFILSLYHYTWNRKTILFLCQVHLKLLMLWQWVAFKMSKNSLTSTILIRGFQCAKILGYDLMKCFTEIVFWIFLFVSVTFGIVIPLDWYSNLICLISDLSDNKILSIYIIYLVGMGLKKQFQRSWSLWAWYVCYRSWSLWAWSVCYRSWSLWAWSVCS